MLLIKLINKKESSYTNIFNIKDPALKKKDLAGINKAKKMSDRNKNTTNAKNKAYIP